MCVFVTEGVPFNTALLLNSIVILAVSRYIVFGASWLHQTKLELVLIGI